MADDARERWGRISALLDAALARPPEERGAFVRAIEDPALRRELARLLEASERADADERLATGAAADSPGADHGAAGAEALVRAAVADRYRIERELGRG